MNRREFLPILLVAVIAPSVFTHTLTMPGCSSEDVRAAVPEIVAGARSLVQIIRASNPDKLPGADKFLTAASGFYDAWQQNEIDGMALLPSLLKIFRESVLPLFGVSTNVAIAIAGIDAAQRIVSRYWQRNKEQIEKNAASSAVATSVAKSKGVDVKAASSVVGDYLKTPKLVKP